MTSGGEDAGGSGPLERGRPADPFGAPRREEKPRPGTRPREIPIGVPESPADFDERKRAAERPERSEGDAQIDRGDDGGSR